MNSNYEQEKLVKSGPAVILVRTQMAENIGSVARAMGNFGFSDLRIVSPQIEWPNNRAVALACKSSYIIDNAQIFTSLSEALIGCDFSYAMSARYRRRVNKEVYTPKEAVKNIKLENQFRHKVAFVFGAENNGLDNTELVLAQNIISIPTSDHHKALNIAQSACVLFYELFDNIYSTYKVTKYRNEKADMVDMDNMVDLLDKKLISSNFYKDEDRRKAMLLGITNI